MAGIGKTTLVKEIYKDQSILDHFNHHVWITLGPRYQPQEILIDILVQIYPNIDRMSMREDEALTKELCAMLSNKRCLIVLDDVWSIEALQLLEDLFQKFKVKVLVTTRIRYVTRFRPIDKIVVRMRLLNKEESWNLLCQKVFAEGSCPHALEKAGKRISENCDGLPLLILTVANHLSKAGQDLRHVFSTWEFFSPNHDISNSRIIKLWDAEGFLEPKQSETVEEFANKCLVNLVDKSVVMVCQRNSYSESETCRLHSVFWHLSNSEAAKNKFFHVLDTIADNSMEVTVDFGLRLLRVMDALTTSSQIGELPASISNLCILQYLIVSEYLSIKSTEELLYLPVEIWDMKELKHLHVTGRSLTTPQCGVILPNLSTLLDVSAQNCTYELFQGIPNLKKLGIQIELDPDDHGIPFHCLDNVSSLSNLESLECVIVNPEFKIEVAPIPMFPLGLKKLSLSGLGYPWEHMSVIGELEKLEVLELRCFAFQGAKWVADAYSFKELQFLLLEDMDLVQWEIGRLSFNNLEFLSIKHCYQLEELPHNFSSSVYKIEVVDCNTFVIRWAEEVKEVDLNNMHISRAFLEVEAHASWDDAKQKLN
ncbi:putative late blight resistance protein homolog R1A-4 [Salvia miltiorrhiza]|uniref:putative late blight resistance protein homolog R1A-4 n=1 Tax=Salvia miltiorrhiza TaxID=226208 RepID=UPI0025AB8A39|nr:putative late blight resistance protein homolog R1A-4 [Salvia miltiorrhiza]